MAFDSDGTSTYFLGGSGILSEYSEASVRNFNTEAYFETYGSSGTGGDGGWMICIFPELRNVTHFFRNLTGGTYAPGSQGTSLEYSTNTTTGADGDWLSAGSFTAYSQSTTPNFRTNLGLVSATNAKGFRWYRPGGSPFNRPNYCQFHVWGVISPGQTPHRIDFCDQTGAELSIDYDFGDQPRNSERIWSPTTTWNQSSGLYLRNRSNTMQAKDISLTFETTTNDLGQSIKFSLDNVTYTPYLSIANINPQQIIGPIYISHNPDINRALGVKAGKIRLIVSEWL